MITALDVQYDDNHGRALAAAVVLHDWPDKHPAAEYTVVCRDIQSYVAGEFYRRELPCLLAVLRELPTPPRIIVIDGFVTLGDLTAGGKPGLGLHLWEALGRNTPIIGVAKTSYHGATAIPITRGESKVPLYITAVGIEPATAAQHIQQMAGPYRIPDLLRRVDQLARSGASSTGSAS
jgi:deoxyribonuclease V